MNIPMRVTRPINLRDAMRKAFIGVDAAREAGLLYPQQGLPGGSKVLSEKEDENSKSQKKTVEKCSESGGYYYGSSSVGIHGHTLIRSADKTSADGSHEHFFMMPNGIMLATSFDGAHSHALNGDTGLSTDSDGAHSHAVRLIGGLLVETDKSGAHSHEAYISNTAYAGAHTHSAVLEDGTKLESLDSIAIWKMEQEYRQRSDNSVAMAKTANGESIAPNLDIALNIPIMKADEDKRLATGVVLEPDEIDTQNHTISPEVIEEAAHNFLARYNHATRMGVMHKMFGDIGIELVESYVSREDTTIGGQAVKKGSWIMTVKVTDNVLWAKVKSGEITGFSIGGVATVV